MAKASIPPALRLEVIERAHKRCEYCHRPDNQDLNVYPHEIDHITARKHGGQTLAGNLAYACFDCNRFKGADLSSIDPHTGRVVQLFNPREQQWSRNFRLLPDGTIIPRTAAGRATLQLLHLNNFLQVRIRAALIADSALSLTRTR